MLLYIETNFIIGTAKGQDSRARDLLDIPAPALNLVLPDVCIMEAWTTFEREQKEQEVFERDLRRQIIQLRRDTTVAARNLSIALEQARLDYALRINAAESHFRLALQSVGRRAELLALTSAALSESLTAPTMEKSRDNLILTMILSHARAHPGVETALLTGDTEFKSHVENAGIKYFAKTEAFLGWFSHR